MIINILFICVANSIRSQIAEGLGRKILAGVAEVYSAGSFPSYVNPLAIQVLDEIGINISQQQSKSIDSIDLNKIDLIITLCDEENCPVLPAKVKQFHWPMIDPVSSASSSAERLTLFRKLRDELIKKMTQLKEDIQMHRLESGEDNK